MVALRAIADANGGAVDYDHLSAALGLSLMTTAVEGEPPGRWSAFGRDAFLGDGAGLFGFSFRALHPPDAAVGLKDSAEFPIHFRDSYVPLIRRALENDQPVLAWMGWPGPAADSWGVITGYDDNECRCTGTVLAEEAEEKIAGPPAGRKPAMLLEPSYQLYVVERYEPTTPDRQTLRTAFFKHSAEILANKPASYAGVRTGPAAYEPWYWWLRETDTASDAAQNDAAERDADDHRRLARKITNARRSALQFLAFLEDPRMGDVADLIERQRETLVSSCNAPAMRQTFADKMARGLLAERIRAVQEIESQIAGAFS